MPKVNDPIIERPIHWKFVKRPLLTFYPCPGGLIPCPYVQGHFCFSTPSRKRNLRELEFGKSQLHFSGTPLGTVFLCSISIKHLSFWRFFPAIIHVITKFRGLFHCANHTPLACSPHSECSHQGPMSFLTFPQLQPRGYS